MELVVINVHGQPDLLEVVGTLNAIGGLAGRLYRRQQQANQDRNDGDYHQHFDQGKTDSESSDPGPRHGFPPQGDNGK